MLHTDKILILAPHTDDGELGCGASIAKYTQSGKEVTYVAFSTCRQSLPPSLPADILALECKAATKLLGVKDTLFFDFDVRRFNYFRQDILEEMVMLFNALKPETVFVPAAKDIHQDHQVIHTEALRAFKSCNLLGYELPWNNTQFSPTYFEKVDEACLQTKQKALSEYHSQAQRSYMNPNFVTSLATVRGVQCNRPYAEAFEVYRLVG